MIKVLDGETRPKPGYPAEYALQPWRYREGSAEMFCIGLGNEQGNSRLITDQNTYADEIKKLNGQLIYGWNLVFDVAWLLAHGVPYNDVFAVKWIDSALLWKWVENSQYKEKIPAWSLSDGVKRFCEDELWAETFMAMKEQEKKVGENNQYWEARAKFDCIATAKVTEKILRCLEPQQIQSALIECACIVPVARSWVIGVPLNFELIDEALPPIRWEMYEIECRLGVANDQQSSFKEDEWVPSKVLRSSTKLLPDLLYNIWKLPITNRSEKTGNPSTDKATLTYLADDSDMVIEILRWRKLNTRLTKYIQSPKRALEYLGRNIMHPSPRLFSTYTGRMTYQSKTSRKYPTGIALHQWPREKEFRALLIPPKGFMHAEYDASSQESRLIAEKSKDPTLMNVFKNNLDFHSFTGANISMMSYEEFMQKNQDGDEEVTGTHGLRKQGKFNNLSNNYRIGVKKQRVQARVQYGMVVDIETVRRWQKVWHKSFPGIKHYWGTSINTGKTMGYAETLGGRRYKLQYWHGDMRWTTESSAINFPIQGSGADMKELAIWQMQVHFSEFIFWFDLHDGLHYLVPKATTTERLIEGREMLNNLDYKKYWNVDLEVPLIWDCQVGENWAELERIK